MLASCGCANSRIVYNVGTLTQLLGVMHCVAGFCFALTSLAGRKLAKAIKPRIVLWYSQAVWGIITVQSQAKTLKARSSNTTQDYRGSWTSLDFTFTHGNQNLLCEASRQARYNPIALNTQESHQRPQKAGSAASSQQFGAHRITAGLLSSHGGHGRWETRHSRDHSWNATSGQRWRSVQLPSG